MKNRRLAFFRRTAAAALAAALLTAFGGCRRDGSDGIHVYSNGTSAVLGEQEVYSTAGNAEFYVPEGMVTDYYKTSALTDAEREIYDSVLNDLGSMKERVPLEVDSTVLQKVLEIIRFEQLAYFHIRDRQVRVNEITQGFDIVYEYRFTADEISSMNIASERAARAIMEQITPDMDDYDKLKFFHDYLVLNCENDTESPYSNTIYGALVQKNALCEGYAKAFSYLCNLAGIENTIVTGLTGAGVYHMWNMVKLGGNWYHVDVTWDNPDDALHAEYPDVILYQYFMVTDSVIENNHTILTIPAEPPKANGRNENYFVREGTDINSEEEFLTVSQNAVLNAVRNRERSAMVKFASNDMYISVKSNLDSADFEPIRRRVQSDYGINIKLNWTDYYEQYRILTYIIEYV